MKKAVLLFALSLFFNNIFSQEIGKRISGDFKNASLVEFFQLIEKDCSCRFYYDEQQLDSVILNFTADNELLKEVRFERKIPGSARRHIIKW